MALRCYVSRRGMNPQKKDRYMTGPTRDRESYKLLAAGRRNDAIHSQIFHHLPIVIEAVAGNPRSQLQPRDWALPERSLDRFQSTFSATSWHCFVNIRKRPA